MLCWTLNKFSSFLTRIFFSCSALKKIRPMFWTFSAIWICSQIQNSKNMRKWGWYRSFLNGSNFMQNGIISYMLLIMAFFLKLLTKRYIFQFTKWYVKRRERVLAKALILKAGIIPVWSLNKFLIFFKVEYFIFGVL